MNENSVAIILLNWNSYDHTNECLESLNRCTYKNFKTIVVDNASTDDSLEKLKNKFNDVIFLTSDSNRGFAGGCNIGILYALHKEFNYIMLLNNDTIVAPNFLKELINASEKYKKYSIFTGKAYYYENQKKIHMAGGKLNWIKGNYSRYGADSYDEAKYNKIREVEFASAYFLLAKSEVFKNIGVLCEDYFFGQEEVDFGARYSKYGYKVLYVPSSVIWHKIAGSHVPATPRDIYNVYRNKLIYMEKFLPKPIFWIWRSLFTIHTKVIAPYKLHKLHVKHGGRKKLQDIKLAITTALKDSRVSKKMTREDYLKFPE
jgi:hypothetical protein